MFCGLMSLEFEESSGLNLRDLRAAKSLCLKIKSRYKVVVQVNNVSEERASDSIQLNIAYLNNSSHKIQLLFEKIASF